LGGIAFHFLSRLSIRDKNNGCRWSDEDELEEKKDGCRGNKNDEDDADATDCGGALGGIIMYGTDLIGRNCICDTGGRGIPGIWAGICGG
jgi:hypothetical protein